MLKDFIALGLFALLLASCTSKSILFYDDAFAMAEPTVISTWKALPPWKDAEVVYLTTSSSDAIAPMIQARSDSAGLVIAAFLSSHDRLELTKEFPNRHFIFVGGLSTPGVETATVSPQEAWSTVARAAASHDSSAAWVLFPTDASQQSRMAFAEAWRSHGGKSLLEWQWPDQAPVLTSFHQGFDWAGPEADSVVLQVASGEVIHGLPPTSDAAIKPGIRWVISPTQLVHDLYQASTALSSHSIAVVVKTLTPSH